MKRERFLSSLWKTKVDQRLRPRGGSSKRNKVQSRKKSEIKPYVLRLYCWILSIRESEEGRSVRDGVCKRVAVQRG